MAVFISDTLLLCPPSDTYSMEPKLFRHITNLRLHSLSYLNPNKSSYYFIPCALYLTPLPQFHSGRSPSFWRKSHSLLAAGRLPGLAAPNASILALSCFLLPHAHPPKGLLHIMGCSILAGAACASQNFWHASQPLSM
jgi:hypothetical protein